MTVRQNVRYKLPNSRNSGRHPFYWLLALALAALLAWLWWNSGKTPTQTVNIPAPGNTTQPIAPTSTRRAATPLKQSTNTTAPAPVALDEYPRPVQNAFEAQ